MQINLFNNCLTLSKYTKYSDQVVVFQSEGLLVDYSLQEIDSQHESSPDYLLFCVDEAGKVYCVTSEQAADTLKQRLSTSNTDNVDIFSDLLETDLDQDFDLELVESTVPVLKLDERHIVHEVQGQPTSICSFNDVVVVSSIHEEKLAFSALKVDCSDSKPVVKHENKRNTDFIIRRKCENIQPHLVKIVTSVQSEGENDRRSTDSLEIDSDLFKCLFGSSTMLLNSPVYLYSPPSGNVYGVTVNSLFSKSTVEPMVFDQQISDKVLFKMLCETSSNVVNILTMMVPYGSDEGNNNPVDDVHVLIVCCSNGSLVTFHYDGINTRQEMVSQLSISGPIIATNIYNNRLYHSTPSHVYETSLEVMNGPQTNQKLHITTQRSRKQAQVYRIFVEQDDTLTEFRDSACILHCIQRDGQCRSFDTSEAFRKDSDVSSMLHMKDVLLAIDQTDREQQTITETITTYECLLEQISVAAFLLNRYLTQTDKLESSNNNQPISVKYKAVMESYQDFESQGHVNLQCDMTNQMPRNLSADWSIGISAIPECIHSKTSLNYPTTFSPLLDGFKAKETARVRILIPTNFVWCGCDLLVTLNLDLSHIPSFKDRQCLSINVCTERLTPLHVVVSKQAIPNNVRRLNEAANITNMIEELAQQQPLSDCLNQGIDRNGHGKLTNITITKMLQFTNTKYQQLIDMHGEGPSCVLQFILKDSQLTDKDFVKDKCHAVTLKGHDLLLEVKDVTISPTREIISVSLTLQSDLSVVASLSSAIDAKMKDINISPGFPTSVKDLKILHYKIQAIEADIQTLADKKTPLTEMRQEIGNLYQRLRTVTDHQH